MRVFYYYFFLFRFWRVWSLCPLDICFHFMAGILLKTAKKHSFAFISLLILYFVYFRLIDLNCCLSHFLVLLLVFFFCLIKFSIFFPLFFMKESLKTFKTSLVVYWLIEVTLKFEMVVDF